MKFTTIARILTVIMLVLFLTMMPIPAHAEEEVTGSFEVGSAAPTVNSVQLWTTGVNSTSTSDMSPQVEYNVKVDVSDANTLDNLNTVTVRIFYDSTENYTAGEESGPADTQTLAILTWTNGGSWSIEPSADTSWVLLSDNCVEPSLSASSGTFEFYFEPGKVATETIVGGDARWHIYAEAVDDSAATANNTDVGNYMNWYGEITVNGPSSVHWDSLTPGMNFGDASSNWTGISVLYIANGAYDEQIATSVNWIGASDNATLDVSGNCTNTNEFSLKADDTATLGNEVLVTASPSYVPIDESGTQTTESGDTITTNTIWLKLSSVFLADTYNGSIYLQIANGED